MYSYAQAEVLSLPIYNLDKSGKLGSSKTKNNLARVNGSPDSLFGFKLDSDQNGVGFNNSHVGNHIITVREHHRQTCNCQTSFLAAYGTNLVTKTGPLSKKVILYKNKAAPRPGLTANS